MHLAVMYIIGEFRHVALVCSRHQRSCTRHSEARNATIFIILSHNCRVQKSAWVSYTNNLQQHTDTKFFQVSLLVLKDLQWWLLLIHLLEYWRSQGKVFWISLGLMEPVTTSITLKNALLWSRRASEVCTGSNSQTQSQNERLRLSSDQLKLSFEYF